MPYNSKGFTVGEVMDALSSMPRENQLMIAVEDSDWVRPVTEIATDEKKVLLLETSGDHKWPRILAKYDGPRNDGSVPAEKSKELPNTELEERK